MRHISRTISLAIRSSELTLVSELPESLGIESKKWIQGPSKVIASMSLFQNDMEWLLMFITSAIEEIILRASPAGAISGGICSNRTSKACNLGGTPLRDLLFVPSVSAGKENRG